MLLRTEMFCMILSLTLKFAFSADSCFNLDIALTQKIENEGFHRNIRWLLEMQTPDYDRWSSSGCELALLLDANAGMFVNPDQIAELARFGELSARVSGEVNVETPAHESKPHQVYVFVPNEDVQKISLNLPIHLRYQRAQITGGFGKVHLAKPSLLAKCPKGGSEICGRGSKISAPCNPLGNDTCSWKNITYQALFEEVELFVPIGDLDDYPLVSIVTLLLGCAGCIYVLSILSTAPL